MTHDKELSAIAAAIGGVRFMDPPDGGDVSLAEQVLRMRQALEREEKWREQFDCCMCGSRMGDHGIGSGHSPVSMYDYHQDQLAARTAAVETDIAEFMRRLGPRWFLEQNWFPAFQQAPK